MHPLSLRDKAPEQAETLAACGVDGVRLAYAYHGGRWLLSTSEPGNVADFGAGRWFASPAGGQAEAAPGLVLPSQGDLATSACAALTAAGLGVTAWLVGLHQSPLVRHRPDLALLNVFGHRYEHALCPAQPDVVRYARHLVADAAAQQGVSGLELEAFGYLGWAHQSAHDKFGVALRPVDRWLLSLCVCEACARRYRDAGADVDELRDKARNALREQFRSAKPPAEHLADDARGVFGSELLTLILRTRSAVTSDLVEAAADAAPHLPVSVRATCDPYACDGKSSGDLHALARAAGGLTVTNLAGSLEGLESDLAAAARTGARVTAGWSLSAAHTATEAQLAQVARAARGCAAVAFYAYDLAPSERLSWLSRLPRTDEQDEAPYFHGTEAAQ
ncbi:hypothetical protein [Streptomyces sp. NPDC003456]|uniref:hypothetical protein n=1 Tax=Streptomyces sp. NPDC003456 TaxID=3364683 RepID=UPI0036947353